MPQLSSDLNGKDTLSSISLYIGIPTQEYRTIQGNLTKLIGNVLRLAHKLHREESEGHKYTPLIEGASAYVSVFGHWVSLKDQSSRVDDHSEVVEFFMSPDDYHPTLLLILCEVTYPALLLANQDAILMLLEHAGEKHRVMLWKQSKKAGDSPRLDRDGPLWVDRGREVNDHPLQFLKNLFIALIRAELKEELQQEPDDQPTWLSDEGDPNESDSAKEMPLYRTLLAGWSKWTEDNKKKEEQYKAEEPELATYFLPNIRIRIILDAVCWWLFYSASQTIKEQDPDFWGRETAGIIIRLLESVLTELGQIYFPRPRRDMLKPLISLESDDPLANALLWLAFVHDFMAHNFQSAAAVPPWDKKPKADPYQRADPVFDAPDTTKTTPWTARLMFDEIVKEIPCSIKLPDEGKPERLSYWKSRLDFLEKLNDRYFPDDHLLGAWRYFLNLVNVPRITLSSSGDKGCNKGYSVKWTKWLCDTSNVQGPDMWVQLHRTLREAPPATKLWMAPLTLEAIFAFVTLGLNSKPNPWKMGELPELKDRLEVMFPKRTQGVSTITKMASDAIASYPFKLYQPSSENSLAWFIYRMQK